MDTYFRIHETSYYIFTVFQAHVRSLSLKAPRFKEYGSGKEVCLIDTSTKPTEDALQKDERLFAAHLLIADKTSPEFDTKYASTRHNLTCEFRVLKVRPLVYNNLFISLNKLLLNLFLFR